MSFVYLCVRGGKAAVRICFFITREQCRDAIFFWYDKSRRRWHCRERVTILVVKLKINFLIWGFFFFGFFGFMFFRGKFEDCVLILLLREFEKCWAPLLKLRDFKTMEHEKFWDGNLKFHVQFRRKRRKQNRFNKCRNFLVFFELGTWDWIYFLCSASTPAPFLLCECPFAKDNSSEFGRNALWVYCKKISINMIQWYRKLLNVKLCKVCRLSSCVFTVILFVLHLFKDV